MLTLNDDPRPQLITTAQYFYQKNWMLGTAGNLSARLADGRFWITARGKSKGNLRLEDFVLINRNGQPETPINSEPSAETTIHQALYHRFPSAQACYHIHSIYNNLISRFVLTDSLPLPPLEMLKGFGIKSENPCCAIPIFANHLEVTRIAGEIAHRFQGNPPQIPALLIRDHGVTVWADTLEIARNYLELLEYIFHYMVLARQIGG